MSETAMGRFWSSREMRWLTAILVLAAVLRIVWVVYAAREPQELHDPTLYFIYANEIAEGNGYGLPDREGLLRIDREAVEEMIERGDDLPDGERTAYYPVGYPAALGGVFALVKYTPLPDSPADLVWAAASFNVLLGVATVALAFFVASRLFNGAVGLLAALGLAVFPNLIFHTTTFLTETLFNFLVMAALAVLLAGDWRGAGLSWRRLLAFGAILGLSVLVRPISLLLLPLLLAVWLAAGFEWRRALRNWGLVVGVVALVILPWAARNAIVMRAPIIISANLGDDLCIGHHAGAPGHFTFASPKTDPCNFYDAPAYEGLDRPEMEVRRNSDNIRSAIKFALRNPRFEIKILSRKAWYLWESDHDGLFAAESYGTDPFIGSGYAINMVPAELPDGQVALVAARLAQLTGAGVEEIAQRLRDAKAGGDPSRAIAVLDNVDREAVADVREEGLPGVSVTIPPSFLRTALARTADIFFFITISLGGLGLAGFVLRPLAPQRVFFLLTLLAFAGVPLIFFGDSRFHLPVMPLLTIAAAWTVITASGLPRGLPRRSWEASGTSGVEEVAEGAPSVTDDDAL